MAVEDLGQTSWASASFRDPSDPFRRDENRDNDEENLKWAALEKLPTYDRMRKGILRQVVDGMVVTSEIDVRHPGMQDRKILKEMILKVVEEDNERFLLRLRERIDRVGIELPKIEVRFEDLSVEADTYYGGRALPTLFNATMNTIEGLLELVWLSPSKKKNLKILNGVSGILKPSRMTLLLGPPGSGKTTLLLALAGKLDKKIRESGKITYCGHELSEFIPQRTSAYISQCDLHNAQMTVRETLDFAGRCLGVGTRYELISELSRREKEAGIKPDPEIDAFMKAVASGGQRTNLATDYILKVLGLDICADILVGDEMRRGISGGQKKRVTTGEMLAGPARALFMDEISTGLDSSTTIQIVKFIRQMVRVMNGTVIISLLQPAPETFNLFDDVILLSDGQIVYHGPREDILEFFEFVGFKCPERKGIADFLQEVTSKKDQAQYWFKENQPYRYISVPEFVELFKTSSIGKKLSEVLRTPYDKSKIHPAALAMERYGISTRVLLKACFSREWLLMKRNSFLYIFKTTQITLMSVVAMTMFLRTRMHHETIADGGKYFGALFYSLVNMMFNGMAEISMTVYKLPIFYKHRDLLFFPPWAYGLAYCLLKIPLSVMESGIWTCLTYYVIGFAPAPSRFFRQFLAFICTHQMALAMFRFIGAAGRSMVVANSFGNMGLLLVFVLGGFIISKDDLQPWWKWGYWSSPLMYAQNAVAVNEFLDPRWDIPNNDSKIGASTIGKAILKSRGMFVSDYSYWVSIGALVGFCLVFNACFVLMLTYLNPPGSSQPVKVNGDQEIKKNHLPNAQQMSELTERSRPSSTRNITATHVGATPAGNNHSISSSAGQSTRRGMVLPFQPLSLTFSHVNYYVDMPVEMKNQEMKEDRLRLLCDVSGAFRPGVMTALVGVSGAGKTTLMDVLAGRKTGGWVEGSINISGYPKCQQTFARISGYCEQNDIHSPHVTVYESLVYSAWLRLAPEIDHETRKMFVEEVMELVELNMLRDALVGLPGIDGLSTEQRKRLTIAVELVSNPSIIFMDEPTSGLDARAAAIVMRTVRNTVDTGRTVVCTIHQPSIDIFEAFDELLMMKRGGQVIFAGSLGRNSRKLIEYFEAVPGVPRICEGQNPAAWMLDITSTSVEERLNLDFAEVYTHSSLYQKNQELIEDLSRPLPNSKDLYFPTKYSQSFTTQCMACFWKLYWSYWRDPAYNVIRFLMTLLMALLFGTIFWNKGGKIDKEQDLLNLLGGVYTAILFLGVTNTMRVQPIVAIERTVFYREKAAGMYSPLSYAFAQLSIELIYIMLQSLLYVIILFPMIGFDWQAQKFLWFLYFIFLGFVYFTMYGMMAIAITPSYQVAGIVTSFFLSFWNLFSGFIIPRLLMPIWWKWCYWTSPVAWTIYGVVASQLGDKENMIDIPGQSSLSVKDYLKGHWGIEHSFLGYAAIVHVGFALVFTYLFAYGIKYLNYQKR